MRKSLWLFLGASLALTGAAQAQTKFKSDGASSAGICAAALDLAADFKSQRGAQPQEIINMQRARDFFAEMPNFDRNEISDNAQAFVRLMTQRMAAAQTPEKRGSITQEIGKLSKQCFDTAVRMVAENSELTMPPAAVPTTQPAVTQPYVVQPTETQPYVTQPLETQPLILNPQPQ